VIVEDGQRRNAVLDPRKSRVELFETSARRAAALAEYARQMLGLGRRGAPRTSTIASWSIWSFCSVPNALRHEQLESRLTQTTVEIFDNRNRVWAHRRSSVRGGFTTVPSRFAASN
jgi:hypothetical protein